MSTLTYLKSFLKDKDVASVTPTSRFCIRHVCKPVDFGKDITIVEYGAGAGVFSKYLLTRMTASSRLYLFETNELLFEKLEKISDSRVECFNQSVEKVLELLPENAIGQTDYIISGIPFSFLDNDEKDSILEQSYELLKKNGEFLAYQTSGHLKKPLQKKFNNVHTEWEWRNIPPMTIYEAEK
ncbi:MAG TPA: hypothetical protein VF181_04695 [Balneolaceae bacterium]